MVGHIQIELTLNLFSSHYMGKSKNLKPVTQPHTHNSGKEGYLASDPAKRRLARILSDEEYGPKLARLRGEDEMRVLRLIDENRGGDARKAILEADENRRAVQREKKREREERKRLQLTRSQSAVKSREQKEREAVRRILSIFGRRAREKGVKRNVAYMTNIELDFTLDADEDDLILKATEPPNRTDETGKDLNPFWYH